MASRSNAATRAREHEDVVRGRDVNLELGIVYFVSRQGVYTERCA